jgi:transmembrane sensor
MTTQNIQELFRKYLDETISQDELLQLCQLVEEGYEIEKLDTILESAFANPAYAAPGNDFDRREILTDLLNKITIKELYPEQPEHVRQLPARRRYRLAWAAAALVLLIPGAYLAMHAKGPGIKPLNTATARQADNTKAPAGARATLTLSNGQHITLDSVGTGTLAMQGNALVRKLDNGQLAYNIPGRAQRNQIRDNPGQDTTGVYYNTLTTAKGGQTMVVLADGSKVWLNALSSLRFPTAFTGSQRIVELKGEAYMEVTDDKSKPFLVNVSGRAQILVLGTHFNINAYTDEPTINTTLLEGAVRVSKDDSKDASQGSSREAVTLKPGEQAQLGGHQILIDKDANTEEVMAWKNGYFSFDGATVEQIMRQVGRWYDLKVVYQGDVKDERFAGSVPRTADAAKLLETLSLTQTVRFELDHGTIYVKPFHP